MTFHDLLMLSVACLFLVVNFAGAFFAVDRLQKREETNLVDYLTSRSTPSRDRLIEAIGKLYYATTSIVFAKQMSKLGFEVLIIAVSLLSISHVPGWIGFFGLSDVWQVGLAAGFSILISHIVELFYELAKSFRIRQEVEQSLKRGE